MYILQNDCYFVISFSRKDLIISRSNRIFFSSVKIRTLAEIELLSLFFVISDC